MENDFFGIFQELWEKSWKSFIVSVTHFAYAERRK